MIHAEELGGKFGRKTIGGRTNHRHGTFALGCLNRCTSPFRDDFRKNFSLIGNTRGFQIPAIKARQKLHLPGFVLVDRQRLRDVLACKPIQRRLRLFAHRRLASVQKPLAPNITRIDGHQGVVQIVDDKLHVFFSLFAENVF